MSDLEHDDAIDASIESIRCEYLDNDAKLREAIDRCVDDWTFHAVLIRVRDAIHCAPEHRVPTEKLALIGMQLVERVKLQLTEMAKEAME